jgi:hypothetical protein
MTTFRACLRNGLYLTVAIILVAAGWFWYYYVYPQLRHARVRARVTRSLDSLALKRPQEISPAQWASCVHWTHKPEKGTSLILTAPWSRDSIAKCHELHDRSKRG